MMFIDVKFVDAVQKMCVGKFPENLFYPSVPLLSKLKFLVLSFEIVHFCSYFAAVAIESKERNHR